jgi:hypothetical protein
MMLRVLGDTRTEGVAGLWGYRMSVLGDWRGNRPAIRRGCLMHKMVSTSMVSVIGTLPVVPEAQDFDLRFCHAVDECEGCSRN